LTGDVVNLRRARKAMRRTQDEAKAALNRAAHGRSQAEREAQAAETDRVRRVLDGARRDESLDLGDGG